MFLPVLRRLVIVIFTVAAAFFSLAQQTHFIYLQTESGQPFYVKINNKVVSSSSAGYLILPKLTDGDYKLSVGFPKKEFPEENFQVAIDKKNEGFLLKNFGEKGWGLFNMQTYGVVMGGNTNTVPTAPKNLQDDQFSKLLANVVKDSSILEKREPVQEDVKTGQAKEEIQPLLTTDSNKVKLDSIIAKADSTNARVDSVIAAIEKTAPAETKVSSAPMQLLPPTRFLNKKDKVGREMIYIDHSQNPNDTIRIFIPSAKSIAKAADVDTIVAQDAKKPPITLTDSTYETTEPPVVQMKPDTSLVVAAEKKNVTENKDTIISNKINEVNQQEPGPVDSVAAPANKTAVAKRDDIVVLPRVIQSSPTNSDCKAFASNEDFLKLRKKMAAENSDDNMIKTAKKAFHIKCFSTEQIKDLSFLFLTNAGKYMFFDMAYPFAADSEQYSTLQSELTDAYYVNRFKAMIHK